MHYLIIAVLAFALSMLGCEGKTGPAGSTGAAGVAGPQGVAGPAGPVGPAGADGATGPAGPPGADGADGAPGAKGDKGDPGERGPEGPQGEKGDPGEDGADGQDATLPDPGDIPGGLLTQVHHIEIGYLDDDGDKTGAVKYLGPSFMHDGSAKMNVLSFLMSAKDTRQLVVKVASQDGKAIPGATVSFTSDDPVTATVNADGEIVAVQAGDANIVVSVPSRGIAIRIRVDVIPAVDSVVVTGRQTPIPVGYSYQLTATAKEADGTDISGLTQSSFKWISDAPSIASVKNGLVTGKSGGVANITATYAGKTNDPAIEVTVTPAGSYSHTITPGNPDMMTLTVAQARGEDGATLGYPVGPIADDVEDFNFTAYVRHAIDTATRDTGDLDTDVVALDETSDGRGVISHKVSDATIIDAEAISLSVAAGVVTVTVDVQTLLPALDKAKGAPKYGTALVTVEYTNSERPAQFRIQIKKPAE